MRLTSMERIVCLCVSVCAFSVNDTRCFWYFGGYVNRKKDCECFLLGLVMEWCKMMEGNEQAKRCVYVAWRYSEYIYFFLSH